MNVRLIKEARELLPWLAGTLGLTVLPYAVWGHEADMGLLVAFGVGCVLMAASSFGSELQHGTVGLLLAQPVPRAVLWHEKMGALALSMAVSLGVAWVCLSLLGRTTIPYGPGAHAGILLLVALCAFCATPYLTLAMQLPVGAVVCSLTLPMTLLGIGDAVCRRWLGLTPPEWMAIPVLVGYGAICYTRGYRTFQRMEVTEVRPADLELPARLEGMLRWTKPSAAPATDQPFRSLLRKELGLQQPTFLVAGVSFLGAMMGALIHWASPAFGTGIFAGSCAIGLLLVPLLTGALAIAEENALGVADWQRTLPPSRGQQWSAKMLVTVSASLAASLVLATTLFIDLWLFKEGGKRPTLPSATGVAWFILTVLLLTSLAVYAGSFCRNTLKAILLTLALAVMGTAWSVVIARLGLKWWPGVPEDRFTLPFAPGMGWSVGLALLGVLALLQWLAFANDHRGVWSLSRKALQFASLLAVLGALALAVATGFFGWA